MFNTWMDGFKIKLGFPGDSDGKESTFSAGDPGLILGWAGSLEKGMQPTLALLPRESHGQRSLASYSPWAMKSWTSLSYKHYVPLEREFYFFILRKLFTE